MVHSKCPGDAVSCPGVNSIDYAGLVARRPSGHGESMDPFNATLDSNKNRKKGEAFPRFPALSTRETSGWSAIDFLECCHFIAYSLPMA